MKFAALLGSEVRRLLARRVVRWGLAVALAIAMLVVVIATMRSTGTGPTDHTMKLRALWLERPGGIEENAVLAMSTYVFILVVGVAATAVGGDYRAGTMGTLLTWEPRRVRVALARLGAATIVAVGLYVVVIGIFVGTWALGATWRGSTAGLGTDFWANLVGIVARGVVGAALLAVITAGLAFITRNTVGAVLGWFGYLIGIEAVLANRIDWLPPSLLIENLGAFLQGSNVPSASGVFGEVEHIARPGDGLIRVVVIAAVVAALGVLAFRRRDVI